VKSGGGYSGTPPWTLPPTAQNLITTYVVDSQGRTIEQIDPDTDVTCTVYNDPNQAVLTYPGWHENSSGQWLPSGPVSEVRTDLSGTYSETLTYAWTNVAALQSYLTTNNTPNGDESLTSGYVTICSLTRSIMNDQGQVVEEDDVARAEIFN